MSYDLDRVLIVLILHVLKFMNIYMSYHISNNIFLGF